MYSLMFWVWNCAKEVFLKINFICFSTDSANFKLILLSITAVVDDVQSFIDKSRRLIIILSKNYISDKVMFELETGLHKALVEKKIKVIVIEYMPIHDFSFLPKSLELLSSSQVVKWKKDKSLPLNSRFWKKLRCAMPAKSVSRRHQLFSHPRTEHEHLMQPAYHSIWTFHFEVESLKELLFSGWLDR